MTIKQLRGMLKGLPGDFDIAMDNGENSLIPICPTDSHVCQIQFDDTKEKIFVFVLCPCSCDGIGDNTLDINLN